MIDADNFAILALFVHFQASIVKFFGILALFQAIIADNLGVFKTLGKIRA